MGADLERRLNAAAEGADYEAGLSSDDAEISDTEQAGVQEASDHPEFSPGARDEEKDVGEEEVDIMNSPLQGPSVTQVGGRPSHLTQFPQSPSCMGDLGWTSLMLAEHQLLVESQLQPAWLSPGVAVRIARMPMVEH